MQDAQTAHEVTFEIPSIHPLPCNTPRCRWSVMLPTFNTPPDYLRQALESVLQQDPGAREMQIVVVDDASTTGDAQTVVRAVGRGRVEYQRNDRNLGQARNLNRCIELARGHLVHLLHADDYVRQGFYDAMTTVAEHHPEAGLFACRCYFVGPDSSVRKETPRVPALEKGGRDVSSFFHDNPLQTPGVVVRRESYERAGGFSPSLLYLVDLEAWVRLIAAEQGVQLSAVLACYRVHGSNLTSRAERNGIVVRETNLFSRHLALNHAHFDGPRDRKRVAKMAWVRFLQFLAEGDHEAAEVHRKMWTALASRRLRIRYAFKFWTFLRWQIEWRRRRLPSHRGRELQAPPMDS